ncbi:unnamed protein product [Ectocarpus sp. 12 AP-2014]
MEVFVGFYGGPRIEVRTGVFELVRYVGLLWGRRWSNCVSRWSSYHRRRRLARVDPLRTCSTPLQLKQFRACLQIIRKRRRQFASSYAPVHSSSLVKNEV